MQSRLIINIVLLLLVIGLSLFLVRHEPASDEAKQTLLSDAEPESIDKITIQRADKPAIVFNKTDGDWRMSEPLAAPAHPTRIQAMLALLSTVSTHQLAADSVELQQLGLEQPVVALSLNDTRFEFGATNPLDQSRYLRVGATIHTISDQLFPQLNTNPSFFINPKLLLNAERLQAVKTPEYTLLKQAEQWTLNPAPEGVTTTANVLHNAWQQLEANHVSELTDYTAGESILVSLDDDTELQLDIVSRSPELILANPALGLQYHISPFMAERIFPVASDTPEQ